MLAIKGGKIFSMTIRIPTLNHSARWICLSSLFAVALLLAPPARAGLAVDLNLSRFTANGTNYYYTIGLAVNTNSILPNPPFGSYIIASPGYPTNYGNGGSYTFDSTNGFVWSGSGSSFYGDFNSVMQGLTNGLWTI